MAKRVERWEASNGSLHMTEHEANRAEWADLVLDLLKCPKPSGTEWESSWWDGAVAAIQRIYDIQSPCNPQNEQLNSD